jgi:hypothetical protein
MLLGHKVNPGIRRPSHSRHSHTLRNLRRYSGALRRYQAHIRSN